jgi:hypothetical protein
MNIQTENNLHLNVHLRHPLRAVFVHQENVSDVLVAIVRLLYTEDDALLYRYSDIVLSEAMVSVARKNTKKKAMLHLYNTEIKYKPC